jgi:hypothetical protein
MGESCNDSKADLRRGQTAPEKPCVTPPSNLYNDLFAHPEQFMVMPAGRSPASQNVPDAAGGPTPGGDRARKSQPAESPQPSEKPRVPTQFPTLVEMPAPVSASAPTAAAPDSSRREQPAPALPHVELHNSQSYELNNLRTAGSKHSLPDAMVRIPENFDPSKPINLVVYNHGYYTSAPQAFSEEHLAQQMTGAPPNTVLIVPEWQSAPGSKSPGEGSFGNSGQFDAMVQDIFNHTPELKGKTLNDIGTVGLIAHSAGYEPAEQELYSNRLGARVNSVTTLDSNYDNSGFDPWIQRNIKDLAAGRKQFTNVYFDTAGYSEQQAQRVQNMLSRAGLSSDSMLRTKGGINADTIARFPIVFKAESRQNRTDSPHFRIPKQYVAIAEDGAAEKEQ